MVRARPLWIYIIAPALGMLAGAEIFLRVRCGAALTVPNSTTPTTLAASFTTRNRKFYSPRKIIHPQKEEKENRHAKHE